MLRRTKSFLLTATLGGLTVILPITIILIVFSWIFSKITDIISPMTNFLIQKSHMQELFADVLVIIVILFICFIVGLVEKTQLGNWFIGFLDKLLLKRVPGYTIVKETILQFIGEKKQTPFSSVALVRLFGNETMATAFITDEHEDGSYTVFVPTGPNPTSGNIYHLKEKYVHKVDFPVESTMRSIISCGAGSQDLIKQISSKE